MGVSGLAEGFLAGFNTMDRYQHGQQEEERLDKAMSLRDAMWQNELGRQKVADEHYQSALDYNQERELIADERVAKQFSLAERRLRRQNVVPRPVRLASSRNMNGSESSVTSNSFSRKTCRSSSLVGRQWPRVGILVINFGVLSVISGPARLTLNAICSRIMPRPGKPLLPMRGT